MADGQNDEAREFLKDFLQVLMETNEVNREVVRTNLLVLHGKQTEAQGQQQIIQLLTTISAQLDGTAQRMDYLYDQLGRVGEILLDNGESAPTEMVPRPGYRPTFGSMIGEAVVDGVDTLVYGTRGRGGRRRRR